MAYPSVTNTLTNNELAQSDHLDTNFNDIVQALQVGDKDINVLTLTVEGLSDLRGNITMGNSSSDDLTINARLISNLIPQAGLSLNLGSSTKGFISIYLSSTNNSSAIYFSEATSSYIGATTANVLWIYGQTNGFTTGISYPHDGYLRFGSSSDLEVAVSSDDIIIRDRTSNQDLQLTNSTNTGMLIDGETSVVYANQYLGGVARNAIINGDFDVWQRNTTGGGFSGNDFVADRWRYVGVTSGNFVFSIDRDTDVPTVAQSGSTSKYSQKLSIGGVLGPLADEKLRIDHILEDYDAWSLFGKQLTLSFWVKSNFTGTYNVVITHQDKTYYYVTRYVVSASATWEYKTVTFTYNPATTFTAPTGGTGLVLSWLFHNQVETSNEVDTWNDNGSTLSSPLAKDATNFVATAGNYIKFSQVQLAISPIALPFLKRSFGDELKKCERYYEKSYRYATVPGAITHDSGSFARYKLTGTSAGGNYGGSTYTLRFKTRKRTPPTMHAYSGSTGTIDKFRSLSIGADVNSSIHNIGETGCQMSGDNVGTSGLPRFTGEWTADSELTF